MPIYALNMPKRAALSWLGISSKAPVLAASRSSSSRVPRARKAHQRLAHLLCELSARVNGAGLLQDDTLEMPLTQIDLAAALAMSTVHLNIALQRLRSAGLVELRDKHLVIRDRARLDAIAGFDDGYLLQWPTRIPDRRNMLSDGRADGERRRRQNRMID